MNHSNFARNQTILAQNVTWSGGTHVNLIQYAGGMSFQHCMTPHQAREMAADLLVLAAEAEALKVAA